MEAGIVPLLDEPCAAELVRVLTYPRFELDAEDIQTLLGDFLPYVETVAPGPAPGLPRCRDKHDQKFLQLAARGKAKVLVTGDKALLALAGQVNFSILTAAELKQSFSTGKLPGQEK
jgi:putative PIN family toxin of toxin-antitoxin system